MAESFVTAIIVCAGNSTRMGLEISKQFIPIMGRCAIEYTLTAFEKAESINEVLVVCRESDEQKIKQIAKAFKKVKAVVYGGKVRSESVFNGIKAASESATHFAIHDGARILIKPVDINRVVEIAVKTNAATLGVPVTDTIKTVDNNSIITGTPKRSELMAVQTPQVFEKGLYLRAVDNMNNLGCEITDDCQLVEAVGAKVLIANGSYSNIKLTVQSDIKYAQMLISDDEYYSDLIVR